ncbi:hypothetical protein [Komagataeibacter europaeus]|uniref:hypothetical protein n=1 Tax=Komagataeibacter europaeus TaxID=33995 RepID=UPI001ABF7454|nr:hypothetical protein [Komagataeibacter europaeus]
MIPVRVANTRKGQTALLRWIGDMKAVARVVFEPTCPILGAMEDGQTPITRQSGKW